MTTELCFIDTETTGLDLRIHQPYELCYWHERDDQPTQLWLPHTLEYADPAALRLGRYFERNQGPWNDNGQAREDVVAALAGVTLVGSNPAFDAAMLTRFIGAPLWHHRMIDVAVMAMVVFDLDRPIGLAECADRVADAGFTMRDPDHTAYGDVRTTRAVWEGLRHISRRTPPVPVCATPDAADRTEGEQQ